jgi:RND family efflux transporter MFP subunit
VAEAQPQSAPVRSSFVAQLRSRTSVVVRPRVSGYVRAIRAEPGSQVAAGAVIVELDPAEEAAALDALQSAATAEGARVREAKATARTLEGDVQGAEAELRLAESAFARGQALEPSGAVSADELDRLRKDRDVARANLDAASRRLDAQRASVQAVRGAAAQRSSAADQQGITVDAYSLRAPFAGTVGDVDVRIGQLVDPTTAVSTVDDPSAGLDVRIQVPAQRGAELRTGLPVELLDGAGAVLARTSLEFVAPRVDPDTQTILALAHVAAGAEAGALRSGQVVRARIIWREESRILVPLVAVRRIGGKPFVFVATAGESPDTLVARQRAVTLGPLVDQSYPVLDGLQPGEQLVTAGVQRLRDGATLAVEPEPPAAAPRAERAAP